MTDHDRSDTNPLVSQLVQALSPELREDFEERAAIMEFDGELAHDHAEALALLDVLLRHPDALLDLDLFAIGRDGDTRYLLCHRGQLSADRLRSIGYEVTTPASLHALLQAQFDGIAMLAPPRPEHD